MPLRYSEQERQVQVYDYLVFVCGVEISQYTKSIEVYHTDRSGPNSATIVLANPFDQWILTESNLLKGIWRKSKDKYSEKPKFDIYLRKKKLSKNLKITRKAPSNQKEYGSGKPPPPADMGEDLANEELTGLQGEDFLQRYSFGPGSCIFSKMDTVKIFIRNPYEDPDTTDQWMPFFTGTVGTKPFSTNYITGDSSVTLNCYDVRSEMQGMRISVNPYTNKILANGSTDSSTGVQASNASQIVSFTSDSVGLFKDFYPTVGGPATPGFDNVFAGKTFVDAISMIITGKTGWVNGDEKTTRTDGTGVGDFKPGSVYRYKNAKNTKEATGATKPNRVNNLYGWNTLCLFGKKKDWWTLKECQEAGSNSFYDGTRHPFTGNLHWLIPDDQLLAADMITSAFNGANNIMGSPDWTDRYSLISQMSNQVDYEFTVTGDGDIIFEFPMYDFTPENFLKHAGIYRTKMHVMSDTISDEGGDVLSGLEANSVSSQLGQREVDQKLAGSATQLNVPQKKVIVFSNVLASKYGARVQSVTFTGVSSQAALLRLATIEFQKRLANANKLSFSMVFRPFLRPNRPFDYAEPNRRRMGKTTTVSFSMPVLQEPTMNLSLTCVKLPIYIDGEVAFQHLTGAEAMALSYNEILEPADPLRWAGNGDRGMVAQTVDTPTKGAPSTLPKPQGQK